MPDEDVHRLAEDYWETVLKASPTNATILGDHRYDDRIEDLSEAWRRPPSPPVGGPSRSAGRRRPRPAGGRGPCHLCPVGPGIG